MAELQDEYGGQPPPEKRFPALKAAEKGGSNILNPGPVPFIEQLLYFVEIIGVFIANEDLLL